MSSNHFTLIPWCVEDAHFMVKVEMPSVCSGEVVEIRTEADTVISPLEWDAFGFDDFQLGLCVARALNDAESAHDCRCGSRCVC